MYREKFVTSQVMHERYYEFHHYYDEIPPEVDFHQHSFYEIFFFLSGDVNYIIEGRTYKLRPGDLLLTSSLDIHKPEVHPTKPYERIVIWLADDFFDILKDFYGEDFSSCFTDAAQKDYRLTRPDEHCITQLKQFCDQMSKTKKSDEIGSSALMASYLIQFLVHLSRSYYDTYDSIKEDVMENDKINRVVQYINDNLSDDLSLDKLAQNFYTSKYYLSKQFKQFTGLSIYQYIMKKRLIISRNLLRSGTPVMDACMQCGFNDYSNFLKAFKREFGRNPSTYVNG